MRDSISARDPTGSVLACLALVLVLVLVLVLAGCGGQAHRLPAQAQQSPKAHLPGAARPHVAVILMENDEYGTIIGARDAPYMNSLARTYALATNMYAITHPSLPNYLALTGGSTFGITSDCTGCVVKATSIVDQLERAGISWKAYMEDLPHACFTGASAGEYAKKHDPFVYYTRVTGDPGRCGHIVPLSELASDEQHHALPYYTWITPNLCNDLHDCDTATGDRFLKRVVPALLRALGPDGLLILTWDEGTSDAGCCRVAAGGHVATILAGGAAQRGARLATPVDHYSVLRTIEDLFDLPRLRGAACACTPSLQPLLRSG